MHTFAAKTVVGNNLTLYMQQQVSHTPIIPEAGPREAEVFVRNVDIDRYNHTHFNQSHGMNGWMSRTQSR